jgi:hypothetical protein
MTNCPNCNKELESSFGPKTCPQCGTLVFVSFDGTVEQPTEPPAQDGFPQAPETALEQLEVPLIEADDSALEMPSSTVPATFDEGFDADFDANPLEPIQSSDEDSSLRSETAAAEPVVLATPAQNFKRPNTELDSIQTFANSEISDGHEGDLLFDVTVEGLDTESVRRQFRDALVDRRFQIDPEATMRNIRNGAVRMVGLSSIKASVLIHRLKELPVEVTWIQRRLIENDPHSAHGENEP